MFSSLQLPFLQALGYAIANSLWQLFLLWLIVVFVNNLVKQSSHIRYVTAVSAQVAGFVWFVSTFQFYYKHCQEVSLQAKQLLAQKDVMYSANVGLNDSVLNSLVKVEAALPYLSIAYLFLLLLLLVKWTSNFRLTNKLGKMGLQPANAGWQRFVNETADKLGILQTVALHLSEFAKSPLTIGYIKPIILLPLASLNQLSAEQMEAVLLHELAHIKRADYLINILMSIVEIVLFFNPFTRLLSKTIKEERENCCDDWVLQYQYDATMYAEALLRLAYLQNTNGFQMNASANKKGELLQRVKRMIQPEKTFNYKHQITALFLITGVLFFVAWLQPVEQNLGHKTAANVTEINKKIIITPLTAQVDNPLFNAASLLTPSLQEDVKQSLSEIEKTYADSIAEMSLSTAQNALQKELPAVVTTLSSIPFQKLMTDAKEEANKSLQSIDWKKVQENISEASDSSVAFQSMIDALQNKTDEAENAKQTLATADEPMLKEKNNQLHFYFDKNFLQQVTSNAFDAVKNINFKALADSIKLSSTVAHKLLLQLQAAQDELRKKQRDELKKLRDRYKKAEDVFMKLPPASPQPPAPVLLFPPKDEHLYNTDASGVSAVSTNVSSSFIRQPVYRVEDDNSGVQRTIRIINKNDSSSVNIIIEIRQ